MLSQVISESLSHLQVLVLWDVHPCKPVHERFDSKEADVRTCLAPFGLSCELHKVHGPQQILIRLGKAPFLEQGAENLFMKRVRKKKKKDNCMLTDERETEKEEKHGKKEGRRKRKGKK